MALTLNATARLNTTPFTKSLSALSQAVAAANKGELASATKAMTADQQRIAQRVQGAQAITAATKAQTAAEDAAAKASLRSHTATAQSLNAQRYLYQDVSSQLRTYGTLIAALPVATIAAAAAWEYGFAKVVRTSDLKNDLEGNEQKINALRDSLVGMAQAMPASFGDITEVATLANQMGVAASETAAFTRAVIMFSEASGVSVDMSATAFGRLKTIVSDVGSDYMGLADSMLKVGVNSVATESEIINVTTQISSIAAQAGFTSKEMIALSGALASVRVPPELSRGLITRTFGQIDKAIAQGGTSLDTFARISGRTSDEVRQQWGGEGSAALFNDFLRGLRDAGASARSEIESLGITSVRDVPVLLRIANAADSNGNVGELFTQTLNDANNAAGETQAQYTIMAETVVGKLKILGNNVMAFFDEIGQSNLGMFGDLLDSLTKGLRDFTRSLDEPNALFGMFGATNADMLGMVATLGLLVGGFTLLGSGIAKVMSAAATFKTLGATLSGVVGLGGLGGAASSAGGGFLAFTKGAKPAAGAASSLLGSLTGVARFMTGPWGIALGLGAITLGSLNSQFEQSTTSVEALTTSLSRVDVDSLIGIDQALRGITIGGLFKNNSWETKTNPFAGGLEGLREAQAEIMRIREANEYDWFGTKQISEPIQWLERSINGSWDDLEAFSKLDESMQKMVDAGNGDRVTQILRKLHDSGADLNDMLSMSESANMSAYVDNLFATAGIERTDENLQKFINGSLRELNLAMTGMEEGAKVVDQLFGGDTEQMGKFAAAIDTAAAAFVDFTGAYEASMVNADGEAYETFSLSRYTDELKAGMEAQAQWSDDMVSVSAYASTALMQQLAEMGPSAAPLLAALADELGNGVTDSLDTLEAALEARTTGLGNVLAERMANLAWAKNVTGDEGLGNLLASSLSDEDMSALYTASEGVGEDIIQRVMQGVARGKYTVAEAIAELTRNQQPEIVAEVKAEYKESNFAAIKAKLQQLTKVDLDINPETTIESLRSQLGDSALNSIELDGKLSLEDAYRESKEFQLWAQAQGIDIFLGADDANAKYTVDLLAAYANGTVARVQLDALPDLATGQIWDVVTLANGTTGFVQVDAETGLAVDGIIHIKDTAGNTTGTVQLTANDVAAMGIVKKWNGMTVATSYIDLVARDQGVRVSTGFGSGKMTQANGGIVDYYANGGIRNENHVAQIAPAGTWRVWAEEETGGEAYIPLAAAKRARSEKILSEVAGRFGMVVSKAAQYADGGYYYAQQGSRNSRGISQASLAQMTPRVQVGQVTFESGEQHEQFREFSRTLNRIARGVR